MAKSFTIWQKLYKTFIPKKRSSLGIKSCKIAPDGDAWSDVSEPEKYRKLYEVHDVYYEDYMSWLDKGITKCVHWTGTMSAFIFLVAILIAWIVVGIVYNAPQVWQIVMQDGQSIQTYFWDTLLMRQQLDDNHDFLKLYGRIKSRGNTYKRILRQIASKNHEKHEVFVKDTNKEMELERQQLVEDMGLEPESGFQKLCIVICKVLGSLPAVIIYWIGIFIWVGCGAINGKTGNDPPFSPSNPEYGPWSNNWQMYINTAVAVELLITSMMLENVRSQTNTFVKTRIELLDILDCKIEALGRYITGDDLDNDLITVNAVERKGFQKCISIYAEIIGTGVGLIITAAVFGAWIGVGHLMSWNSNWWLIIGTYTGLIGFIDGFTLREVFQSITVYERSKFLELLDETQELLDIAGIGFQVKEPHSKETIGLRVSRWVNHQVSNQWAVVASIAIVIGLICAASGMHWSETGQLIANSPTMIIEGFCLLVLIQAHGWADHDRQYIVEQLAVSRKLIMQFLEKRVEQDECDGLECPEQALTPTISHV